MREVFSQSAQSPIVWGFHEPGNPSHITREEGMANEQLRARPAAAKSPLVTWRV